GRRLADDLADRGHQIVVLTRSPRPGRHRQVGWDGRTVQGWAAELAGAAARLDTPVPVWIQASTLAIHGDGGEQLLDEHSAPADGPPQMPGVAVPWERAAEGVHATRTVLLRTS